jgi:hypothetical protein
MKIVNDLVAFYDIHRRKGEAETCQIFLRDTHILPKLYEKAMRYIADMTGGSLIAI